MVQQHFYALLATSISTIAVSLIILCNRNKKSIHIKYICYIMTIGWWSIFQAFGMTAKDSGVALVLWRTSYYAIVLIPVFFSNFVLGLNHHLNTQFRLYFKLLVIVHTLLSLGAHFSKHLFVGVKPLDPYPFIVRVSGVHHLFLFSWALITVMSLALLYKSYKSENNSDKKRQYGYFIFSMVIAYAGGVTNYLPFYNISTPLLNTIGTYLVAIHIMVAGYAILAKGLMGADLIIKKTFVYSFFILSVSTMYMALTYGFHLFLLRRYSYQNALLINTVIFIIIASTFKPIELLIKKFLDHYFFKGTIDQISEQKEHLESELERTHRLKSVGILAAGMAHEIRNPIQSLRTFGEHLEQRHNDPEFRAKFEKLLIQETDRIKNLTSDLLEFSKPKEPKKMKTNLNDLIQQTLSLVESELLGELIKIATQLPDEPIYKEVDPEQIKQALLNLILNAKDAMRESREKVLTISLQLGSESQKIGDKKIGDRLRFSENHENRSLSPIFISIQDTGCGIIQEKIPHLFDPFYTDKKEGTGLGLAITHSIIERHGGKIEVESEIGCGSRFVIMLSGGAKC